MNREVIISVLFAKVVSQKRKIYFMFTSSRSAKVQQAQSVPMDQRVLFSNEELIRARYKPSTLAASDSAIRIHERMGYPLTYEGIVARIRWQDSKDSHADLRNLLHAVERTIDCRRDTENALPDITEAQHAHIIKLIAGRPDKEHKHRGAITYDRMNALITWIRTTKTATTTQADCLGLTMTYALGLRKCQMKELVKEDFCHNDAGVFGVWMKRIHNPNIVEEEEMHFTPVVEILASSVGNYVNKLAAGSRVLPGYNEVRLGALIKEASIVLKWTTGKPDDLVFDGVHCIRHGVLQDIAKQEGNRAAAAHAGHSLPVPVEVTSTTLRYTASDEERREAKSRSCRATGDKKKKGTRTMKTALANQKECVKRRSAGNSLKSAPRGTKKSKKLNPAMKCALGGVKAVVAGKKKTAASECRNKRNKKLK